MQLILQLGFSIFRMNYKMLCQDESYEGEEPCFLAETTLGSVRKFSPHIVISEFRI